MVRATTFVRRIVARGPSLMGYPGIGDLSSGSVCAAMILVIMVQALPVGRPASRDGPRLGKNPALVAKVKFPGVIHESQVDAS
jgi:hypothetical protein